jgi:hypothetical protein
VGKEGGRGDEGERGGRRGEERIQVFNKAYSLLADCQIKISRVDELLFPFDLCRHVNTMLLLASFPPYPGASHDPNQWLDSLMKIAHKSRKSIAIIKVIIHKLLYLRINLKSIH